jgi:hypothetical protein
MYARPQLIIYNTEFLGRREPDKTRNNLMCPFLIDEQVQDAIAHLFSWSGLMGASSTLSTEAVLEQCAAGRVL